MKPLRLFLARVGSRDLWQHHICPPMGIMYLAAYIRERFNAEIRLVDQRLERWPADRVVSEAVGFGADIVGLSAVTPSAHLIPELTGKVREGLPNALVAVGGPHASALPVGLLEDSGADVAVVGEGELSFERVVHTYLEGSRDFGEIPGLVWRGGDGTVVTNPGQIPYVEDLDSLPMPAYDLIDIRRYWGKYSFALVPNRRYLSLVSSRGCPYQCYYCHNVLGKRFRAHSAERMVEEIARYFGKDGVTEIEFLDDVFNYDYDRAMEFCELVHKRNIPLRFAVPNGVRTDLLSEELIEALANLGLYCCAFALESASPRIQNMIGKRLRIPAFLENAALAVKHGIFANGFSMLGFPGETEEEMRLTVDTMCRSMLHTGQFHTVVPFPGTRLYDELMRTHPAPLNLVYYIPIFLERATKGLFNGR